MIAFYFPPYDYTGILPTWGMADYTGILPTWSMADYTGTNL